MADRDGWVGGWTAGGWLGRVWGPVGDWLAGGERGRAVGGQPGGGGTN